MWCALHQNSLPSAVWNAVPPSSSQASNSAARQSAKKGNFSSNIRPNTLSTFVLCLPSGANVCQQHGDRLVLYFDVQLQWAEADQQAQQQTSLSKNQLQYRQNSHLCEQFVLVCPQEPMCVSSMGTGLCFFSMSSCSGQRQARQPFCAFALLTTNPGAHARLLWPCHQGSMSTPYRCQIYTFLASVSGPCCIL